MNRCRQVGAATAGIALMLAFAGLSACGGMTNAVGVLPNTLDDLEEKSAAARGETAASQSCENPPCQDEAAR
ncbi:hypothetical protein FP2506_16244 [Fulvimarina pelagi HTCC2506]|uniref:Uncharacterized protein n=2 Tax=Fulvimarina pelagi TaxID=217511 RepID=Q0G331_9HYPH|nr:hypothetical protein [Fulvimarina pelagi]EAU42000.1 hypothetical protein FP2506_16244 [Fulvimarina pelagi HTCC2506]BAT30974.1 hypothetical protein [Fulvimarina pelagi]